MMFSIFFIQAAAKMGPRMKVARSSGNDASRPVRLKLGLIRTDAGTQTRAQIDEGTVTDYAEAMTRGDIFPPVVVFRDNGDKLILAEGFHRVKAARKAKHTHILAEIRKGSRTDALRFALGANHRHGLRLTNLDKRRGVEMALTEFGNLSDHLLSEMCGVSQSFVSSVRQQLNAEISSAPRLGKDGKLRALPIRAANGSERPAIGGDHNSDVEDGNGVFSEIAEAFAEVEGFVDKVLEEHPEKRPGVLASIRKMRSDLLDLEKRLLISRHRNKPHYTPSSFPIHVISLGAGVQSSTIVLMAARGELTPMPECAIFADVQNEPASVYRWMEKVLKPNCEPHFKILMPSKGNLAETAVRPRTSAVGNTYTKPSIPFFISKEHGQRRGRNLRHCTSDFKIDVIHRALREVLGLKQGGQTVLVKLWIGISIDEAHRMKDSRTPWIQNVYPLIEKGMSRNDCQEWLERNGFPKAPRSSCTFCPFHSDQEWIRLRDEEPEEFANAVEWEKRFQATAALPNSTMRGVPFLHQACVPLAKVRFKAASNGHSWGEECTGLCGV
jgi:hypothetical protein